MQATAHSPNSRFHANTPFPQRVPLRNAAANDECAVSIQAATWVMCVCVCCEKDEEHARTHARTHARKRAHTHARKHTTLYVNQSLFHPCSASSA